MARRIVILHRPSRDYLNELFDKDSSSRMAAAVDAVLEGLEADRVEFRALAADGEPFHVPDEVKWAPNRNGPGARVRLTPAEADPDDNYAAWVIIYNIADAEVHISFLGPVSKIPD